MHNANSHWSVETYLDASMKETDIRWSIFGNGFAVIKSWKESRFKTPGIIKQLPDNSLHPFPTHHKRGNNPEICCY